MTLCPADMRFAGMPIMRKGHLYAGGWQQQATGPVAVAMHVDEGATGATSPLKITLKLHSKTDVQ